MYISLNYNTGAASTVKEGLSVMKVRTSDGAPIGHFYW